MLDFPNNPSVNQTYTSGGRTWRWDGTKWNAEASIAIGDVTALQSTLDGKAPTIHEHSADAITSGTLGVARGGTGATTLTANNVLLGNGTSAPLTVAPGTSGNVLTSNGTTWQSTAPAASGGTVTSITAGAGLTGGTITSSGTIALDIYSGTSASNTSYPIGSYLMEAAGTTEPTLNSTFSTSLTGTWRVRGSAIRDKTAVDSDTTFQFRALIQRVA
jgi:hypothetical protein